MKSKSTITLIINGAFCFILFFACYQFYQTSMIYFDMNEEYGHNKFLQLLHIFSGLVILGIFLSIIHFNRTIRNWNNSNFFNAKVIKRFEIQGIILLLLGIWLFGMELATLKMPFRAQLPAGFLGLGVIGSVLLGCIGLLFSFIATVIATAKKLKDENDLTI